MKRDFLDRKFYIIISFFILNFLANSQDIKNIVNQDFNKNNTSQTNSADIIPSNWCDDFDGIEIDTKMPEPAWTIVKEGQFNINQSNGLLHIVGYSGPGLAGLCNESNRSYSNFSIHAKLIFTNPSSTIKNQEGNAEIRFRVVEGTGYSLSFKTADKPPVINLRRSDSWLLIQDKSIQHDFYPGEMLYVNIDCKDSRIVIKVGTAQGSSNVVFWDFHDPSFSRGSFWIQAYQLKGLDVDYFYVLPSGSDPFTKSKPALKPTPTTNK